MLTDPSHDVSSVPAQVSQLVHDVGQDPDGHHQGDRMQEANLVIVVGYER